MTQLKQNIITRDKSLILKDNLMINFRRKVYPRDVEAVRDIVSTSGFFTSKEVEIAVELVNERITRGLKSGYYFLFAEDEKNLLGYTCFGPIAATISSYDLYWIVVQSSLRRRGIGKQLMTYTEKIIREMGGTQIYIETSSRAEYVPTRAFYRQYGFEDEAILKNFYQKGDDKVIYVKNMFL